MAVFVRSKRVTDPLNDKVKACLCGRSEQFSSSGSEHDGEEDYDSPSFSNLLIHGGFLQQEDDMNNDSSRHQSNSHADSSDNSYLEDQQQCCRVSECLETLLNQNRPFQGSLLFSHLSIAMEKFAFLKLSNKSVYLRNIMYCLRELGHNAGICKTKWDSTGALTAGSYEYIDVVGSSSNPSERCIIDVDFAGEFNIARPTKQFESLLNNLPGVYIGRSEELKQIIRLMSDAAKKSLKSKDLLLPPWRKNRYMQLKWFAPYRRTTNPVPTSSTAVPSGFTAKCRSVGFNAVINSNVGFVSNVRFVFPAATRTR